MQELKPCVIEIQGWTDKPQDIFLGVDNSSGGYPFYTTLPNAKIWNNPDEAKKYREVFRNSTTWDVTKWKILPLVTGKDEL